MNKIIDQIYKSGVVEDDQGNQYPHNRSSILQDTGMVLYNLIRDYKPKRSLEIGFAYGLSTLFICQALAENGKGMHTAIDPNEDKAYKSIGLQNIKRADLGRFLRFYPEPSYKVLPDLTNQGEKFDFAFVDGNHHFDYVISDFLYIDKMLSINGLIVFDDLWMLSVRTAVSFILQNRAYELISSTHKPKSWEFRFWLTKLRIFQNLFGRDWNLKLAPHNVAILKKTAEDKRVWFHHRKF